MGIGVSAAQIPTDLNTITNGGFYLAINTTANSPVSSGFFAVMHMPTINNYAIQFAYVTDNNYAVYMRRKTAGVWEAWLQLH